MKDIKVRFPHYWIELPYDLPLIELARVLARSRLRLCWNVQARRLELRAIHSSSKPGRKPGATRKPS